MYMDDVRNAEKQNYTVDVPAGLISWYSFKPGSRLLYIGKESDPVFLFLDAKKNQWGLAEVCSLEPQQLLACQKKFDYVISVSAPEKSQNPVELFEKITGCLLEQGHLLLGMNNRFGIRYFCGDRDAYSGRNFDGIENYRRFYARKEDEFLGRCYDAAEIRRMLLAAGWHSNEVKFWSVFPGLENPQYIFAEDYQPNEDLVNRIHPEYFSPETVFLEEEQLYDSLIENHMFFQMANAYLIECSKDKLSDVLEVTNTLSRKKAHSFCTILRPETVSKKCLTEDGKASLRQMERNTEILWNRGIPVVNGEYKELSDGTAEWITPYIRATVTRSVINQMAATDVAGCLSIFDRFMKLLEQTSSMKKLNEAEAEAVLDFLQARGMKDKDRVGMKAFVLSGPVLQDGFFDFVPINSFYTSDEKFLIFDQEFCISNVPLKVMQWRVLSSCFVGNQQLIRHIRMEELIQRYGFTDQDSIYSALFERICLGYLQNDTELLSYHKEHRPDYNIVNANRQRMNFSDEEYHEIFVDIFRNADSRKLILFGSGNYASVFMDVYGEEYPVSYIVDNNCKRWGEHLKNIEIVSPDILKNLEQGTFKVIVCIKNYLSVIRQLKETGIYDFGIYDPTKSYPRKKSAESYDDRNEREEGSRENEDVNQKASRKYHVGYIAGVFDLFHIGHVNLLRRAKEQCDHLIVGVVSDEAVIRGKHTKPFIPFEERIEVVRSCRYVDEAVRIPEFMGDTDTAWRTLHFDVQFSGSDYANDPEWLEKKKFLNRHGADLVFFPYTQQTSSTKIKTLINRQLDDDQRNHNSKR